MKKLLTTILSVLMLCTLATTNVFAEDEPTPDAKETELFYEIPASYEWSVPSEPVAFDNYLKTSFDVEVTKCNIFEGDLLEITVESQNDFNVVSGLVNIKYNIWKKSDFPGGNVFSADTALDNDDNNVVLKTNTEVKQQIFGKLSRKGTKAGRYTDTLTFAASIESGTVEKASGLYKDGEIQMSWDTILVKYSEAFEDENKTIIGKNEFGYVSYFKNLMGELVIDSSITEIGDGAFYNCSYIKSFIIPSSVTSIGENAFSKTTVLSIVIPNTVTSIGESAFSDCISLASITYSGTKNQWNSITLGDGWNSNIPATVVHCSDGDVSLAAE